MALLIAHKLIELNYLPKPPLKEKWKDFRGNAELIRVEKLIVLKKYLKQYVATDHRDLDIEHIENIEKVFITKHPRLRGELAVLTDKLI